MRFCTLTGYIKRGCYRKVYSRVLIGTGILFGMTDRAKNVTFCNNRRQNMGDLCPFV